ncbi:MAG: alcohol dehydrogenase catalytic domain-containing protein [Ruminococcus sp.]
MKNRTGIIEIKVSACGVCGSDIHMWKDSNFKVGDRVVFWASLYCGKCDMCMSGQEQLYREVNGTNIPNRQKNAESCQLGAT